jgi:hypothetical protein
LANQFLIPIFLALQDNFAEKTVLLPRSHPKEIDRPDLNLTSGVGASLRLRLLLSSKKILWFL